MRPASRTLASAWILARSRLSATWKSESDTARFTSGRVASSSSTVPLMKPRPPFLLYALTESTRTVSPRSDRRPLMRLQRAPSWIGVMVAFSSVASPATFGWRGVPPTSTRARITPAPSFT